ncbi:MAG TPA: flp pilus assembly protein CpaB, partial [Sporosarcina sp.]|nr:flp pilus assembly protein CpaB [Sporosarcina sp.]
MLEAKRRAAIFLLLAFILAAVTGYLVLEKVKELNAELGGMTSIYIAKGSIPSRSPIEASQVTKMDIPNKFVTDSHILSVDEFEHQVSIVPLNPGDIITKNMIKPVSNLQDANNRLVTMYRTDKIQFDQVLTALDRVDIIVSTNDNGNKA